MIVKLICDNQTEICNFLEEVISNLDVKKDRGNLSKKVYMDLHSNEFTLERKEGYVELLGFSRIDGNPMFNIFDNSIEGFLSSRKNKISSLLDENVSFNKLLTMIRNPKMDIIKALEDHAVPNGRYYIDFNNPFNPPI